MTRKVLVLYHGIKERAETFGRIFYEREWMQEEIFAPEDNISDRDPLAPDLVLVMGGPMGVYQQDKYPFLTAEIEFLKKRLEKDLPTLGICLGSQLMTAAFGGEVYKGEAGKEIGWAPLTLTDAGKAHPVRHFDGSLTKMFHWHGDTVRRPDNTMLLASSAAYENQAYAIGNALALQFHPEVTKEQMAKWFAAEVEELQESILCKDIGILRAQTEQHVSTLNTQTRLMMNEWLPSVGLD